MRQIVKGLLIFAFFQPKSYKKKLFEIIY